LWVIVYAVLLENFPMKIFALLILFLGFAVDMQAQDTALVNRLNAVLKHTKAKEYDKIMDYTYSKLFEIVPREIMKDAMEQSFDTDEFMIELDSMKIETIYPIFVIDDTSYVVVQHTMLMRMKYTEPFDTVNKENTSLLVTLMEARFGEGNVRFDALANSLNILMKPDIVGIKEKSSGLWTFVNLNDNNPAMLEYLFSPVVIKKIKEYQKN